MSFGAVPAATPAHAAPAGTAPPTVITGPAVDITGTSAALTATITPNDDEGAVYGFEYGLTTAYGTKTGMVLLPGSRSGPVRLGITDLTPGVVYHYRVFAENSIGGIVGADATFTTTSTTAPAPAGGLAPTIAALPLTNVTTTSVTLNAKVNPNGQATTVQFEWGPTKAYGNVIEDAGAGANTVDVLRSTTLTGLTTGTTYHLRITARNASGSDSTKDVAFMPGRGLTKLTAESAAPTIAWGGTIGFEGRLLGAAPNGARLEILRQDYPYKGEWKRITTTTTLDDGTWGTKLKGIYTNTKLRARVIEDPTVYSNLVKLGAQLQVPLVKGRLSGTATQVRGAVFPVAKRAKITLQRYAGGGKWKNVQTLTGKRTKTGRFSFKVAIKRQKSAQQYRAYVVPRDGGAHATTASAAITVPGRG